MSGDLGTLFGWFSCAILLAALSNRLLPWPQGCRDNTWLFSGLAIITLLPIGEHPGLAAGVHGTIGPPSATLAQLALLSFLNIQWPPIPRHRTRLVIAGFLIVFYALSLGAGKTWLPDPYAWGFQATWMLWGLLLLGLWLFYQQQTGWLIILSVDILLWLLDVLPSNNLWDALFDPMLLVLLLRGLNKTVFAHRTP